MANGIKLTRQATANFLGVGWNALMLLLVIPTYVEILGIEVYALIGLYLSLVVWISVLDLGISPTLQRESARYLSGIRQQESFLNLFRSLEIICGLLVVMLGGALGFLLDWVSEFWLQRSDLGVDTLARALMLMGWTLAGHLACIFYRAGLLGLQQQVKLGGTAVFFSTFRVVGVLPVLVCVAPSLEMFFFYQLIGIIGEACFLSVMVRRSIPSIQAARFSFIELAGVARFSLGTFGSALLGVALTQIDKLLLSRLLSLEDFGHYSLGVILPGVMPLVASAICAAIFLKFVNLATDSGRSDLCVCYHKVSSLIAIVVIPMGLTMAMYSDLILSLWIRDKQIVNGAAGILSVYAIGSLINAILHVPAFLQFAKGITRLGLIVNGLGLAILAPMIFILVPKYGVFAAAGAWVTVNLGYLFLALPFFHRMVAMDGLGRWYLSIIIIPIAVSMMVLAPLRMFVNTDEAVTVNQAGLLIFAYSMAFLATSLTFQDVRRAIASRFR